MNLDFVAALLDVILLVMLTAPHEFAHAWVATRLGDDTPRLEGRVTLSPLAHIDWIGTVALPFVTSLLSGGFLGWGKPVNTNPGRLKGGLNGLAVVAIAGPISNVIMAVILGGIAIALINIQPAVAQFAYRGVRLSIYLAILNMLPVPPLDGSKLLLAARVPPRIYMELARYGFMLVLVLMMMTDLGYRMSRWSDSASVFIISLFS